METILETYIGQYHARQQTLDCPDWLKTATEAELRETALSNLTYVAYESRCTTYEDLQMPDCAATGRALGFATGLDFRRYLARHLKSLLSTTPKRTRKPPMERDREVVRLYQFRMRESLFRALEAEVKRRQARGEKASINQVGQEWLAKGSLAST